MNILIIYDFSNFNNKYFPRFLKNFIANYNRIKLTKYLRMLKKRSNVEINIINAGDRVLNLREQDSMHISKIRLSLDRQKFIDIKEDIINSTRNKVFQMYVSLIKRNIGVYHSIFFPKLFEFYLGLYLNEIYGNFEILKNHIKSHQYDKVILFHCNIHTIDLFKELKSHAINLEIYNSKFLINSIKIQSMISILKYIFLTMGIYGKKILRKNRRFKELLNNAPNKTTLFIANSNNQYNSIKPIYSSMRRKQLPALHDRTESGLNPKFLFSMIKFLTQLHRSVKKSKHLIKNDLSQNVGLTRILRYFYFYHYLPNLIRLFNILTNLKITNHKIPLGLVVITNDHLPEFRLAARFFKVKRIPTIFVPHAAIPIIKEMVTKEDIQYLALGGESDKKYYIQKGVSENNIEITGIARYEYFNDNQENKYKSVKDIFNGSSYVFKKHDFTILLTTNPIDDESNEKLITIVVKSLKELKMQDNLVIKLHPRENGHLHKRVLEKLKVKPVIVKDYKILDLIKSCDLLISQKSTTLLEAMLVGTPILLLDIVNKSFRESSKYGFLEEENIPKIKNQNELNEKLKELVNIDLLKDLHDKNKETIEKYFYFDPNESPTEKVIKLIQMIMNEDE